MGRALTKQDRWGPEGPRRAQTLISLRSSNKGFLGEKREPLRFRGGEQGEFWQIIPSASSLMRTLEAIGRNLFRLSCAKKRASGASDASPELISIYREMDDICSSHHGGNAAFSSSNYDNQRLEVFSYFQRHPEGITRNEGCQESQIPWRSFAAR